jgi:uncharacterized membrane protein
VSWYELLLTLHVLGAALWFGSGLAITVVSLRLLAAQPAAFGPFSDSAGWWAGRAHPAAAVVILLAGFGMVADADLSLGEPWISVALGGWVVLLALGGAGISRTGRLLSEAYERSGGSLTGEVRALADRLLLFTRIESAILVLIIADMVAKPG